MTSSSYLSYALNSPAGSVAGAVIPLETGSGCVSCLCHSCCRQLTETSREASFILANDSSLPLGSMRAKLMPRESYINSCSQQRQRGLAGTGEGGNFLSPTLGDLFLQPENPPFFRIKVQLQSQFQPAKK